MIILPVVTNIPTIWKWEIDYDCVVTVRIVELFHENVYFFAQRSGPTILKICRESRVCVEVMEILLFVIHLFLRNKFTVFCFVHILIFINK